MDMKRTLGKFTTPQGILVFPLYLNEPDSKFDDSEDKLKFKAGLRLEGEGAAEMLSLIEDAWAHWQETVAAALGKKPKIQAKNVQWYTSKTKRWDDMGESATRLLDEIQEGELVIKTNCKAYRNGEATRPAIFDAAGTLIKADELPPIGFGSTAKLSGSFYGWTTKANVVSISLILKAVQLIEIVEPGRGSQDAEDYGFKPTAGFVNDADEFIKFSTADDKGGDF